MSDSRSFLVALALCSVSSITSAVCYARVQLDRAGGEEIVNEIPAGESHYALSNNGVCFGSFHLKTDEKIGEVTLEGSGSVAFQWQGELIPLRVELHADFNALRQLGGSYIKLSTESTSFSVSTLNVRPIAVKARWKAGEETREAQTTIPGPVLIRKTARGGYLVRGDIQKTSEQHLALLSRQPIITALSINRKDANELGQLCPGDSVHALNLDPIAMFVRGIGNSLPITLP